MPHSSLIKMSQYREADNSCLGARLFLAGHSVIITCPKPNSICSSSNDLMWAAQRLNRWLKCQKGVVKQLKNTCPLSGSSKAQMLDVFNVGWLGYKKGGKSDGWHRASDKHTYCYVREPTESAGWRELQIKWKRKRKINHACMCVWVFMHACLYTVCMFAYTQKGASSCTHQSGWCISGGN